VTRRHRTVEIDVDGKIIHVILVSHPRARRVALRIDPVKRSCILTRPIFVSIAEAIEFAESRKDWIGECLDELLPSIPLVEGSLIPVRGLTHQIICRPDARRGTWCENGFLNVSGKPEHCSRRVLDWLKQEARRTIVPMVRNYAEKIGQRPGRISFRDTVSRWGSCSEDGNLSFCWRLVLAPTHVIEYVVAHEVGHLAELNHSETFWELVKELVGPFGQAQDWLKGDGLNLYRYGSHQR